MGKKSKPPKAPDYTAAALAAAASDFSNAQAAQYANMVNMVGPEGSVTYTPTQVGRTPNGNPLTQWTQTITMSPEQQAAYDRDIQMNAELQNIGIRGTGFVNEALDQPLDFSDFQGLLDPGTIQQQASDAAYQNAMRYIEPRMLRDQSRLENQLSNQGIQRGSEAWNAAMQDAEASRENVYGQAQNQAYLSGLQGSGQAYQQALSNRQQQIGEATMLQHEPLNILNAVRTGSQIQSSQQPNVTASAPGQMATVPGADLLGAQTAQYQSALDRYNASQAGSSGLMSGLFGLGTAALGNPYGYFSRR